MQDDRQFVIMATFVTMRNQAQVVAMGLKPETIDQAIQRVKSAISDGDDDMQCQTIVSLLDPLTSMRMRRAMRFDGVTGPLRAFDQEWYLEHMQHTHKWQDPFTSKPTHVFQLRADVYL